jgi:16S rRNA (cytidine1402-2'-O)-methyltransferase
VARVLGAGYRVTPIPGPNAAITALSAAGMSETSFLFYGFLPAKAGARRKVLETLRTLPHALVFYEAPHRIAECIDDLAASFEPSRTVVLARELTKVFENIHRCRLEEAQAWLAADDNNRRGEFVLIVSAAVATDAVLDAEAERVLALVASELPPAKAAKLAAAITGVPRDLLYAHALAKQQGGKD